jgi:hypothetical protein
MHEKVTGDTQWHSASHQGLDRTDFHLHFATSCTAAREGGCCLLACQRVTLSWCSACFQAHPRPAGLTAGLLHVGFMTGRVQ